MNPVLLAEVNISEGKNAALVEQLVDVLHRFPGLHILEVTSDADHNRTVFTYLGEPGQVLRATQSLAATALDLIDMSHHKGSHPRLGAVDVVPFVPVRGMSVAEAVEVARAFGRFIGSRGVPVYYYEEAALRPDRTLLPEIRRGEYEGLPDKLKDPQWVPDEGPAAFNAKSGAVVTGVRFPLVALNVNLRTRDLAVAQRIARAVRHSSGGYRYVRALGLALEAEGMVQVSMNLTNYSLTPIPRVLETVRAEAARYGVSVAGTELVGPLPLAALEEIVRYYLQAHKFSMSQVVEAALLDSADGNPGPSPS
jgi:glutamate formiminotransferase